MSRVRPTSPAPDFLFPSLISADGLFPAGTLTYGAGARYPSGKGEVCKTFMRRFDSDPRLQTFLRHALSFSSGKLPGTCLLLQQLLSPDPLLCSSVGSSA